MIYATLDKEYGGKFLENNPHYYIAGRKNKHYNQKKFWYWFFWQLFKHLL